MVSSANVIVEGLEIVGPNMRITGLQAAEHRLKVTKGAEVVDLGAWGSPVVHIFAWLKYIGLVSPVGVDALLHQRVGDLGVATRPMVCMG